MAKLNKRIIASETDNLLSFLKTKFKATSPNIWNIVEREIQVSLTKCAGGQSQFTRKDINKKRLHEEEDE